MIKLYRIRIFWNNYNFKKNYSKLDYKILGPVEWDIATSEVVAALPPLIPVTNEVER